MRLPCIILIIVYNYTTEICHLKCHKKSYDILQSMLPLKKNPAIMYIQKAIHESIRPHFIKYLALFLSSFSSHVNSKKNTQNFIH